jgi:hypothetical protein
MTPLDIAIIALCNSFEPHNLFSHIFNMLYIIATPVLEDCKMQRQTPGFDHPNFFMEIQKINHSGLAAIHCC